MSSEREPLLPRNNDTESNVEEPKQRHGPRDISRSQRYAILLGLFSATFLSVFTLVPTMLPSISSDFKKSNQASWLGTAYLLATCTFTPLYGRLSNAMGRRGANQLAIAITALGTLLCGLSQNMESLIASRFLAGIGGGGIFTTTTIALSDMYSLRSRGLAQGVNSVFNGLGMGLGGPIGGLVTDWLGWRWAFLIQMPFFVFSFTMTTFNLRYVLPTQKKKSTVAVLKRIDYLGSLTLLIAVGSALVFLSTRYNSLYPWSHPFVVAPLVSTFVAAIIFVLIELFVAPEPVMAPFLLRQRIPVLVSTSNFFVGACNFSVTYFFPMWFQTVLLTSASTAGLHLMPNSVSMSLGSLFAGGMMHRTGRYKALNMIFGIFPFIATILIYRMREDSGPIQSWLSIIPLGFGNAVVMQTTLSKFFARAQSHMAVGTGFGQLFRGIGQVGGVAISSALFQYRLDSELRKKLADEDLILRIRQSSRLVDSLPPDLQRIARDAYSVSLKSVFVFAACSTLLAYCARLPIPEKRLEHRSDAAESNQTQAIAGDSNREITAMSQEQDQVETVTAVTGASTPALIDEDDDGPGGFPERDLRTAILKKIGRRLSTYESTDAFMDPEDGRVGGSARSL
ncbi:MFS general substrate transporter [Fistulina hepatica ATCC 64428]|uniref:MFS general substrate transporter n=1 Tax=Fistulina hepatica ATCC 64428 TaxID=1128425 RepID=A0A0D7A680_9AGAR|nr:MFS general substrate transporter [Fistulina hepatica ATCC 64428]